MLNYNAGLQQRIKSRILFTKYFAIISELPKEWLRDHTIPPKDNYQDDEIINLLINSLESNKKPVEKSIK